MIWGGNRILSYKSLVLNMSNIGESWELSGVPGNESVVSNGEFAGRTITELIKEYGAELLVPASMENVTFIPESKMKILTSWV